RVVSRIALLGVVECVKPRFELLTAFGRAQLGVIGNVIAAPHEGVDGAEGVALAAGQDQKRVIEILCRHAGNTLAHGIRHDELRRSRRPWHGDRLRTGAHREPPESPNILAKAAWATRASLRDLEIAGRLPSTA